MRGPTEGRGRDGNSFLYSYKGISIYVAVSEVVADKSLAYQKILSSTDSISTFFVLTAQSFPLALCPHSLAGLDVAFHDRTRPSSPADESIVLYKCYKGYTKRTVLFGGLAH